MIVSVGGDGTINEIVNGLYDARCLDDVKLGIISTGTGADYVRTLDVPRYYPEACQRLLSPNSIKVDLGIVECVNNDRTIRRLFVNFAGLGIDAEIVQATTQRYKALGNGTSYLMGLLTTLILYKNKEISLCVDGEVDELKVCTVLMGQGKYGGGGMFTTQNADPSDGLFDVLTIGDLTKPDLLWSLPRVYKGTHLSHPKVMVKRAKEVQVRTERRVIIQADGDLIGMTPARFSILPGALTIII
jgi:YegS/Rv2252/BmrU family lipid kinase